MPTVVLPNGDKVKFPYDMTREQIEAEMQRLYPPEKTQDIPYQGQQYARNRPQHMVGPDYFLNQEVFAGQPDTSGMGVGETLSQSAQNLGPSASQFAMDVAQPFMHPIDTAQTLWSLGKGIMQLAIPGEQPDEQTAQAVGKFFADRYGGVENVKQSIAKDPVGVLGDLSLVLSGGGTVAAKAPGVVGKAGQAVANVGKAIDPLSIAGQGVKLTGKGLQKAGAGKGISALVGMGTGTGRESIETAYQAGRRGSPDFARNLRGQESPLAVLDDARNALENMRQQRSTQYQTGSKVFKGSNKKMDFGPVDAEWQNLMDSLKEGDHFKVGSDELRKIQEVGDVIDEWRQDPSMHTARGMDALKQRLDAINPSIEQRQVKRAVTNMRNKVKNTIEEQIPEYADVMKDYEKSIKLQQEIEKALSLGDKASADTALRKFQSLTRNNVNTNYGNRLRMAEALEGYGGNIMDKVSGQALSELTPRGLNRLTGMATIGGGMIDPSLLMLAPFQSPRLMGEAAYGAGRVSKGGADLLRGMGITPNVARNVGRGSFQSGRIQDLLNQ